MRQLFYVKVIKKTLIEVFYVKVFTKELCVKYSLEKFLEICMHRFELEQINYNKLQENFRGLLLCMIKQTTFRLATHIYTYVYIYIYISPPIRFYLCFTKKLLGTFVS